METLCDWTQRTTRNMKKVFFVLILLGAIAGCNNESVYLPETDQLINDIEIVDKWLFDNNIKAVSDPGGLRYVITAPSAGVKPVLTNSVVVKYTGKLLQNDVLPTKSAVFDQSTVAVTLKLSTMIKGWQTGLQLLQKGSKATLYLPSGLAYGKAGVGSSIPPNSNVFYEVELIDVK